MRWLLILAACCATPATARDAVPLSPYDWMGAIAPYRPAPVSSDHPLYRKVAIEPVADMPDRIGSTFNLVAHGKEVNEALSTALDRGNLLAPAGSHASAILSVRWVSFSLPFKIGTSAEAQATMRYELRRADNGQVIFRRDVSTHAKGQGGGDASARARGTGRATILANISGALWCLDKAAYGMAPQDCASQVGGPITEPMRTFIYQAPIPHR